MRHLRVYRMNNAQIAPLDVLRRRKLWALKVGPWVVTYAAPGHWSRHL